MTLGENIRHYRRLKGMTIQELSDKVGISLSGLGHFETGKRKPRIETAITIAKALDINLYTLINEDAEIVAVPLNTANNLIEILQRGNHKWKKK